MRILYDVVFCDSVDFRVTEEARMNAGVSWSMEETAQNLCAIAGLELIDYGTMTTQRSVLGDFTLVRLRSKAWRERTERHGREN